MTDPTPNDSPDTPPKRGRGRPRTHPEGYDRQAEYRKRKKADRSQYQAEWEAADPQRLEERRRQRREYQRGRSPEEKRAYWREWYRQKKAQQQEKE